MSAKKKLPESPKPKKAGRPASIDAKSIDRAIKLLGKDGKLSAKQIAQYIMTVGARRILALETYANK
jgi:hypothetical protein